MVCLFVSRVGWGYWGLLMVIKNLEDFEVSYVIRNNLSYSVKVRKHCVPIKCAKKECFQQFYNIRG